MTHSIRLIVAASLLFGLQAGAAFADNPPKLDMTTTCDAAAQFAIMGGRDKEACLDDERTAQGTIDQGWSKYNAADKTQCVGTVKTGGPPSYVELLSCLEIMQDAKEYGERDLPKRSDQPAQSTNRRHR
jgi:hypothetical protein